MQGAQLLSSTVSRRATLRNMLGKGRNCLRPAASASPFSQGLYHTVGYSVGYSASSDRLKYQSRTEVDCGAVSSSKSQALQPEQPRFNMAVKSSPLLNDSHTYSPAHLAAFGCYRVVGPARISKRGNTLVAHLFRGSRVELLDGDGNATPYGSMKSMTEEELSAGSSGGSASSASMGEEECYVGECVLVAAHVELCGSACSVDLVDLSVQPAVCHHNGHTYVSIRSLPPEAVIQLDAGSDLRHPINITPVSPPAASPAA